MSKRNTNSKWILANHIDLRISYYTIWELLLQFSISSTPEHSQIRINTILNHLLPSRVLCLMDCTLNFGKDQKEYATKLTAALQRNQPTGVAITYKEICGNNLDFLRSHHEWERHLSWFTENSYYQQRGLSQYLKLNWGNSRGWLISWANSLPNLPNCPNR